MAINSVNTSTSTSSTTNRVAGLISGFDTETLVKQMSALTKSKINSQQQKFDKLQWKQEAYRSVIAKMAAFKSTYFNTLKPDTNLKSNSLYAARAATSSNSLVTASASSSATIATYNISNVVQKATTASITSSASATNGILVDFSNASDSETYTVALALDGASKSITFAASSGISVQEAFITAVNTAFSGSKVSFAMDDNKLVANNTGSIVVPAVDATQEEIAAINKQNLINSASHSFSITATTTSTNGAVPKELEALGLSGTTSSKVTTSKTLENIAFDTALKGNGFSFEINGTKFNFDKSSTLKNVLDTVNNSSAGVKMSFDNLNGKFSLKSSTEGLGGKLEIKQTSGNLLTSMFGSSVIAESSALSSSSLISNGIQGDAISSTGGFDFSLTGALTPTALLNKKISVTLNGETKEIGLWNYDSTGTKNDFSKPENVIAQLNFELTKNFGSSAPAFSYDESSKVFTLTSAKNGDVMKLAEVIDTTGGSANLLSALGFNTTNNNNEIDLTSNLFKDITDTTILDSINANISFGAGFSVNITKDTTIGDLVNGSNGNMSFENGVFTLKGVDWAGTDEAGKSFLASIFGENYNYPGVPSTDTITVAIIQEGKNAIVEINGTTITNSSNSITIDGTTMDISTLSEGVNNVTVSTTQDTTKAYEAVKSFVEDYNALISDLYSQIRTSPSSSDGTVSGTKYEPLTAEQREDMSDKEIEKWEEKAKGGMLFQDQTINKFLTNLRSMVNGISSSGTSLIDIGITVSKNYLDFGKLEINETKLKAAFETNAEGIQNLFNNEKDGIATRVSALIDSVANTSITNKGTLVQLAGVANTSSATQNRITKQLQEFQKMIDSLQTKYEDEQERYWKKFTNMETMLNNYSSQSSWLTSQFNT